MFGGRVADFCLLNLPLHMGASILNLNVYTKVRANVMFVVLPHGYCEHAPRIDSISDGSDALLGTRRFSVQQWLTMGGDGCCCAGADRLIRGKGSNSNLRRSR